MGLIPREGREGAPPSQPPHNSGSLCLPLCSVGIGAGSRGPRAVHVELALGTGTAVPGVRSLPRDSLLWLRLRGMTNVPEEHPSRGIPAAPMGHARLQEKEPPEGFHQVPPVPRVTMTGTASADPTFSSELPELPGIWGDPLWKTGIS